MSFVPRGLAPAAAVYRDEFEKPLLEQTRAFYRAEAQRFLALNNCREYLVRVEQRLAQEEDRARAYMQPGTEAPVGCSLVFSV